MSEIKKLNGYDIADETARALIPYDYIMDFEGKCSTASTAPRVITDVVIKNNGTVITNDELCSLAQSGKNIYFNIVIHTTFTEESVADTILHAQLVSYFDYGGIKNLIIGSYADVNNDFLYKNGFTMSGIRYYYMSSEGTVVSNNWFVNSPITIG